MKKNKTGKFKLEMPHLCNINVDYSNFLVTYLYYSCWRICERKENGQTIVIPGTYHTVSSEHLNF